MNNKILLIILDGWGITQNPEVSAISKAKTPYYEHLLREYSHAEIHTSGERVGLPDGQMGNSEVGHLNIGAGRIVYQDFVKINKAIETGTFTQHPVLNKALEYAVRKNKKIHLAGLLSDGGVHSHIRHLKALVDMIKNYNVPAYIHAFTDGRDVDPHSGKEFIRDILRYTEGTNTHLASIIGRYYAMDRDKRWERIKIAYDMLVHGKGLQTQDPVKAIEESYAQDITDEFIRPIVITGDNQKTIGTIEEGDVVIFYNFRTDRGRELTEVLTQKAHPQDNMSLLDLYYVTMTRYDDEFKGIHVVYDKENVRGTLGEIISDSGLKQIRIAETEKYPHVTFFFSGGREKEFPGEKRILVPSPKVATYDLQPEMSAPEVTRRLLREIENETANLMVLNFANGDMVGHTGVMEAAIKAVETVDHSLETLVEKAKVHGYTIIITADHGNVECMIKPDGSPHTAHTLNPVPIILISEKYKHINSGILANIAPTILKIMDIPIPDYMEKPLV